MLRATPSVPRVPITVLTPARTQSPNTSSGVRVEKPPSPPPAQDVDMGVDEAGQGEQALGLEDLDRAGKIRRIDMLGYRDNAALGREYVPAPEGIGGIDIRILH